MTGFRHMAFPKYWNEELTGTLYTMGNRLSMGKSPEEVSNCTEGCAVTVLQMKKDDVQHTVR